AAAPLANDPAAGLLPGAQNNAPAPPTAVTGAPLDVAPMTPTVFAVGRASQIQQAAQPTTPTSPPQVAAAPAPKPTPKPAVAKADPKPEPKTADPPKVAETSSKPSSGSSHHSSSTKKPAAAGGGGDVDSAAAADALAKAQLENSL
ncbi:MAG: hypothetical protein ABI461_02090, partial [Polyangiaceae bacterium]